MELIRALLRGDIPLWKSYWLFFAAGGAFFSIVFVYISAAIPYPSIVFPLLVIWFFYSIVTIAAVWKSSEKYTGPRTYFYLARVAVVVVVLRFVSDLVR